MEQKISKVVPILAWLMILSNFVVLCRDILRLDFINHIIDSLAIRLDLNFLLFPTEKIPFPLANNLELFWSVLIIICCFGILKLKNIIRIIFVGLCAIQFITSLISTFFLQYMLVIYAEGITGALRELLVGIIPFATCLAYMIFFTHPKIKEQFS